MHIYTFFVDQVKHSVLTPVRLYDAIEMTAIFLLFLLLLLLMLLYFQDGMKSIWTNGSYARQQEIYFECPMKHWLWLWLQSGMVKKN